MGFRVESRRGEHGPVPLRVGSRDSMREVTAVIDRWPADDHCYVRVETDGGDHYILRQDLRDRSWRVHFFEGRVRSSALCWPELS